MKNLLYKELRLCVPVQTWIFVALNCLCIIPNYPAVATLLYPLSGFSVLFSAAQSDHDPLYTSLLPVHKKDVVKAKMLLVCFLQIVSLLIAIPFAMVKRFVPHDAGRKPLCGHRIQSSLFRSRLASIWVL